MGFTRENTVFGQVPERKVSMLTQAAAIHRPSITLVSVCLPGWHCDTARGSLFAWFSSDRTCTCHIFVMVDSNLFVKHLVGLDKQSHKSGRATYASEGCVRQCRPT